MCLSCRVSHRSILSLRCLSTMYLEELTPHALYMRLKRLCETTKAGNLQVSEEVHQQWLTGNCDELGLALVLALKKFGYGDSKKVRDAVRGEFAAQMHRVKEVSRQKEEQLEGGWYTTDRMKTELSYNSGLITKIVAYCNRFKSVLVRPFKYDTSICEYFVETSSTVTIKKSDMEKYLESQEVENQQGFDHAAPLELLPAQPQSASQPLPAAVAAGQAALPPADTAVQVATAQEMKERVASLICMSSGSNQTNQIHSETIARTT